MAMVTDFAPIAPVVLATVTSCSPTLLQSPESFTFSAYLNKDWTWRDLDIDLNLGYAYTDAEEVSPLTSSRAISNFENFSTDNFNNPTVATANSEVEQRITARLVLDWEWKPEWNTRFIFRGELNDGRPFSYNFDTPFGDGDPTSSGNLFGDSDASEDRALLYVANGTVDPLVNYMETYAQLQTTVTNAAGQDIVVQGEDVFNSYLDFLNASGLSQFAGGIAPRNSFQSDVNGKIDLRIQQNIPLPKKLGNDKLKLIMDIENFTNLLNDEWGIYRQNTFEFNVPGCTCDHRQQQ